MNGQDKLYQLLEQLNIPFEYLEHPAAPTIEIAKQYWVGHDAKHCRNLFFRNHKGNQHYLVILDCDCDMDIHKMILSGLWIIRKTGTSNWNCIEQ
jgi:Ala-tRNA(Pro) deacylase